MTGDAVVTCIYQEDDKLYATAADEKSVPVSERGDIERVMDTAHSVMAGLRATKTADLCFIYVVDHDARI